MRLKQYDLGSLAHATPLVVHEILRSTFLTRVHANGLSLYCLQCQFDAVRCDRRPIGVAGEGPWLASVAYHDQGNFFPS
jgi:hypothetical protein